MKKIINLTLLISIILIPSSILGQKKMIEIIEEKQGQNIIVKAKNLSTNDIQLQLELTSKGLGLKNKEFFDAKLGSKETKTIVKLTPQANKSWNYNISTSYKPISNIPTTSTSQDQITEKAPAQNKDVSIDTQEEQPKINTIENRFKKSDIIVYTKDNCGRCHRTINMLKASKIPYKEKNMSKNKKHHEEISSLLFENGFQGGSFSTPAIVADHKLHYNIKDLESFVVELISKKK